MKTRATPLNPHNRFQPIVTDRQQDDGWYQDPADDTCPDSLATEVTEERVKSIISRNQSPDIPFDQSINPYRGCECLHLLLCPANPRLLGHVPGAGL